MRKLDYKWVALSNTTLGMLIATLNGSILLIALPDIFRGIKIDPLAPGNTSYLLWLILGFLVVMAVLVVSLGRLGDIYGRVRMFNLGFAVFTVFSILLSITWMHGSAGAIWLIAMRIGQGVGGALIFANSSAILTDAFPQDQRGLALGVNTTAAISGAFIGLVRRRRARADRVAARLPRLGAGRRRRDGVVVPVAARAERAEGRADRLVGQRDLRRSAWSRVMIGITYGIQPYGGHTMGWLSPFVLTMLIGGIAVLVAFCVIERRVDEPMFHLELFRIRAFSAGNLAALLASMGRGGLQFILIIWLQGIWLPQHGYAFSRTPLWAGIYMVPMLVGLLIAAPASGWLSDRFGARPFATGGMVVSAIGFFLLIVLPVNFSYVWFALILLLIGDRHGPVLGAEQRGRDELAAAGPARRRRRHARHLHELGERSLDRRLLQPDDRRALVRAAARAAERAPRARRAGGRCRPHLAPAARRDALRVVPRLQPDRDAARAARAPRACRPARRTC